MIPALPLQNKQVLIPRGAKQAKSFVELVKRLGGIPAEIPLLAFRPVKASEGLVHTLEQIHTYDWIIFTSNVTVETFFSLYKSAGLGFPKVAVIGEKTKQVLEEQQKISADFMPEKYVAESFVEEFLPLVSPGTKVFIPKGNLARAYISTSLTEAGAIVDEQVIYETYYPEESRNKLAEMLRGDKIDILAFTSPSTVDHFMETVKEHQLEDKIGKCIVACIGPVAKQKAESYGLTVDVCPETYTVKEMMNSVVEFLNQKKE